MFKFEIGDVVYFLEDNKLCNGVIVSRCYLEFEDNLHDNEIFITYTVSSYERRLPEKDLFSSIEGLAVGVLGLNLF